MISNNLNESSTMLQSNDTIIGHQAAAGSSVNKQLFKAIEVASNNSSSRPISFKNNYNQINEQRDIIDKSRCTKVVTNNLDKWLKELKGHVMVKYAKQIKSS